MLCASVCVSPGSDGLLVKGNSCHLSNGATENKEVEIWRNAPSRSLTMNDRTEIHFQN